MLMGALSTLLALWLYKHVTLHFISRAMVRTLPAICSPQLVQTALSEAAEAQGVRDHVSSGAHRVVLGLGTDGGEEGNARA